MRLFAAVLPPAHVLHDLAAEVAELKKLPGVEALRWTGRPGWHFTLAFYGEVDEAAVPDLSARLERAARHTEPFSLTLRGGGQFGHGKVLWTGAAGGTDTLSLLADRAEAAARRAGIPMAEHRRYQPHLTLARGKEQVDARPYTALLEKFESRSWTVAELTLVRSNLPKSGIPGEQPRYDPVARWPLGHSG